MRRKLVAGNWKMNGSLASIRGWCETVGSAATDEGGPELVLVPPFPYLAEAAARLTAEGVAVGAQDLSLRDAGAYTGEVSGGMLADVGCSFVLVGHSERRALHGESDAVVADKFAAARRAGLRPVLCIGETLDERETGIAERVIARQVRAVIGQVGIAAFVGAVIAYEPVWAIGTGRTASPQQAQEVHRYVRGIFSAIDANIGNSLQIVYGGSVKAANAAELFAMADIDGGLVGGASLDAAEFLAISRAAA